MIPYASATPKSGGGAGRRRLRASADGRLRERPDLPQQAHRVGELPLLRDLAALAPADRDSGEGDVLAGRRRSHQVAVVGAADREARRDVVAVGELLVDRDAQAAQRVAVALDDLAQPVDAARLLRVQDVAGGDDLVERAEVPARRILEAGPDCCLVLLAAAHGLSSRRTSGLERGSRGAPPAASVGLPTPLRVS